MEVFYPGSMLKNHMKKRILILLVSILVISIFHYAKTSAESPKNYLKGKFYNSVKNYFLIAFPTFFGPQKRPFRHFSRNGIFWPCFRVFLMTHFLTSNPKKTPKSEPPKCQIIGRWRSLLGPQNLNGQVRRTKIIF